MGLDNIPKQYACKKKGTAVMVPRLNRDGDPLIDPDTNEPIMSIDCKATQEAGGCPWLAAYNASNLEGGPTLGMFGTDCWYRGKYGNYLLEQLAAVDALMEGESFFGDNEDGTEKSPESCLMLADIIDEALADQFVPDIAADARYASWYLRWAADECDGLICWY